MPYTITATATLVDETTGSPIEGQTIDFYYGVEESMSMTPMPSGVTNSQGIAVSKVALMCESSPVNYVAYASYPGNSTYEGSDSGASNAVTVPACGAPAPSAGIELAVIAGLLVGGGLLAAVAAKRRRKV